MPDGPLGYQLIKGVLAPEDEGVIARYEFKANDVLPFVVSGSAGTKTAAIGTTAGEVFSGEGALVLTVASGVGGTVQSMAAQTKNLTNKIVTRSKLFFRLMVDEDAANWNHFGFYVTQYTGSQAVAAQFLLNSNYGATNAFQIYTTGGATITLSDLSGKWNVGNGNDVWLDIEIGFDFENQVWEYVKIGDERQDLTQALQVSTDSTTAHTLININCSEKSGSNRRFIIDFIDWQEID